MSQTFLHCGTMGDIIYALPTIRAMGGGILYLDTTGGANNRYVRAVRPRGKTRFNKSQFDFLHPLLVMQPYLEGVKVYNGEEIDHDLYRFSTVIDQDMGNRKLNIAQRHLRAFGKNDDAAGYNMSPWLEPVTPALIPIGDCLVNRTVRYTSNGGKFGNYLEQCAGHRWFVGTDLEYECLLDCYVLGKPESGQPKPFVIPHLKVGNAVELSAAICASKFVLANQSLVMSMAIGLGRAYVQEICHYCPDCIFMRQNAQYF